LNRPFSNVASEALGLITDRAQVAQMPSACRQRPTRYFRRRGRPHFTNGQRQRLNVSPRRLSPSSDASAHDSISDCEERLDHPQAQTRGWSSAIGAGSATQADGFR
jgi:hypothetical protein